MVTVMKNNGIFHKEKLISSSRKKKKNNNKHIQLKHTNNVKRTKHYLLSLLSFFCGFTGELKKKVTAPPTARAIER